MTIKGRITWTDAGLRVCLANPLQAGRAARNVAALPSGVRNALEACCNRFFPNVPARKRPWVKYRKLAKLAAVITKGWTLDWYWKFLLLRAARTPAVAFDQITIRVSQVRQWVVLTVRTKDVNGEECLAMAPIIGRSDRLTTQDQYWIYIYFRDTISELWKLAEGAPDELARAYVLGRHDVVYGLRAPTFRKDDILVELELRALERGKYSPKGLPRDLVTLRSLEKRGKPEDFDLLLSSDAYCEALEALCDVWHNPLVRIVHINAPPGSGKEELAKSLHKFKEGASGLYSVVALSPHSDDLNETLLFGSPAKTGVSAQKGLVLKCKNGVLVLDELDKVSGATRTMLLRLLEKGEYFVPGTTTLITLGEDAPLFVFLTSLPLANVLELGPRDLWTRVDSAIEVKHPLEVTDPTERLRVMAEYFAYFWRKGVSKYHAAVRPGKTAGLASQYAQEMFALMESGELVGNLSTAFANLVTCRFRTLSVRNIRAIAARAIYGFAEALSALGDQEVRKDLEKCLYGWKTEGRLQLPSGAIERILSEAFAARTDYPGNTHA